MNLVRVSRRHLRPLLEATERVQRLGALHTLVVHALAVLGALLWAAVAFPASVPTGLRRVALAAFATLALAAVVVGAREIRWRHVQRRCMQENEADAGDDRDAPG